MQLAEKVTAEGTSMTLKTLSKTERGVRPVDVHELVALASALGVSPMTLLVDPAEAVRDEAVRVAEEGFDCTTLTSPEGLA